MSLIPIVQGGHSVASDFDTTLIGNSAWFDGSADYLEKTFSSAPGSQSGKRYVWACWVQPPGIFTGTVFSMWSAGTSSSNAYTELSFYNQQSGVGRGDVEFNSYNGGGSYDFRLRPTQVFRDIAWQHFVVSYDSTESSASNRIKLFHNGEEITSFDQADYPSLNHVDFPGTATGHYVGGRIGGNYKNYMTQHVFLDSQSIQAGDVSINDLLDVFQYGTNGSARVCKKDSDIAALATSAGGNSFCLDFADASNFGNDISGNSPSGENDFTVEGGMGSANQSSNTPSKVYATWNPIFGPFASHAHTATLSEGNLRLASSTSNYSVTTSSLAMPAGSGKFAAKFTVNTLGGIYPVIGVFDMDGDTTNAFTGTSDSVGLKMDGQKYVDGSASSYGSAVSAGNTVEVELDMDNNTVEFLINGSAQGTISKTFTGTVVFMVQDGSNSSAIDVTAEFDYTPDNSNFLTLNTANLTAPSHFGIDHFNSVKYAGNGTAIGSGGKAVTGVGFQPDFVWIKNRDASDSHALYDVVRGTTKQIETDTTAIETTEAEGLSVFGSDGFTVGSLAELNTNTEDLISWSWEAGTAFSNDASETGIGTLDSSGRVSAAGHFSIVSWTGNTTAGATVKHGLSGTPEFIIAIARNESGSNKPVYHKFMTSDNDHLKINEANATGTAGTTIWDESAMSSTVIGLGAEVQSNSTNGMIAYCFRSVPGVCKIGTYEGNGSSDGPYISTGFKPQWVMIKNIDVARDWTVADTTRFPTNVIGEFLYPSSNAVESARGVTSGTDYDLDILSDGFKIRTVDGALNSSTLLFIAIGQIAGNGTLAPVYGR